MGNRREDARPDAARPRGGVAQGPALGSPSGPGSPGPGSPASMADVAQRAQVSMATVSRALRGLPNVSEDARRRVLEAAADLRYVVSPTASRLATGRTGSIAVMFPFPGRWFFGQVLSGAESVFRAESLDVLLYDLGDEAAYRRFFADLPLRRRVDAVLSVCIPLDRGTTAGLRSLGVPVVVVGSRIPGMSSVRIDDVATARTAVAHLADLGHERIAMIQTELSQPPFTAMTDRRHGYASELVERGLPVREDLQLMVPYGLRGGEQAIDAFLDLPEPPTAVFAETDELAYGAIGALRRRGMRSPDDLSIIGIDDHDMSELLDLTTMRQQVYEQGVRAARLVVAELGGEATPVEILEPTELVQRGTTAAWAPRARAPRRRTV